MSGTLNPCGSVGNGTVLVYSVPFDSNVTMYNWSLSTGILSIGTTNNHSIAVQFLAGFTSGRIRVTPSNVCGSGNSVTIFPKVGPITTAPTFTQFNQFVCSIRGTSTSATYSVQSIQGCTSYQWTVPTNSTIVSGQGSNSIQVVFGSTFTGGSISVVGISPCGNSPSSTRSVTLLPRPVFSGPNSICPGTSETYTINPEPGAIRYRFNLPSGLSLVSQSLNTAVIRNNGSFISGIIGAQIQYSLCGWSQPTNISLNTASCRTSSEGIRMSFFPNPTSGEVQLQFSSPMKQVQVSIFGSDGRLIKRDLFESISNQTMNYKGLADGLYHMEVLATDVSDLVHRQMEKLIIQQ